MIVVCPACSMRFQYDESRFGIATSKNFQCTRCNSPFNVANPSILQKAVPPASESIALGPQMDRRAISLAFLSGPKSSTSVALPSSKTIIGREGEVATLDPEMSRSHAMIEILGDGTVWLEDLGSTNGTFTKGSLVSARVQLTHRQEFSCGKSAFMILIE